MEAITIPTDVPAEVHSRWIKDLLTQASKDKATDPIMAYWGE
jgi:hypothetical protein